MSKIRKLRNSTLIKINNFLDLCNVKIRTIQPNQRKLMRIYMLYANRIMLGRPLSTTQTSNLLTYMNYKMRGRKFCPFTKKYCISDFQDKISPEACRIEGPCMLII